MFVQRIVVTATQALEGALTAFAISILKRATKLCQNQKESGLKSAEAAEISGKVSDQNSNAAPPENFPGSAQRTVRLA